MNEVRIFHDDCVGFLPKPVCDVGISRAEDCIRRRSLSKENLEQVNFCIQKLKAPKPSVSCAELLEYTEIIDKVSGMYLKDYIPELYELLRTL